jgi:hypothetical protein
MRYVTATANELLEWGIQELELREADAQYRTPADAQERMRLRAKDIGATVLQANTLCRDAAAFLQRKGQRA